jgi:microcin C transport system substrate-binding protein
VRFTLHYADALRQLGIETKLRVLDSAEMMQRRKQQDFEAMYVDRLMGAVPNYELRSYFHSSQAMQPNSLNYVGIRNPAVDALLQHALTAQTHEAFVTACRALDRVLTWNYYDVDVGVLPGVATVFWNRYGKPPRQALYVSSFPHAWWYDAEKAKKLESGVPIAFEPVKNLTGETRLE